MLAVLKISLYINTNTFDQFAFIDVLQLTNGKP